MVSTKERVAKSEKAAFKKIRGESCKDLEEEPPSRERSRQEDPAAGINMVRLKDRKKASV